MALYTVSKKSGSKEIVVLKTHNKQKAYQFAEMLSNEGWICIIRTYFSE